MKWWKQIWATIKAILNGDADVPDIVPDPVTPAPSPGAMLPKPATLCQPDEGPEMQNNHFGGRDVRCLAWGRRKDGATGWVFAACPEWRASLAVNGNDFAAQPYFERKGIRYVTAGWKAPHSEGPLQENLNATYQKTLRFYYWPTREGMPTKLARLLGRGRMAALLLAVLCAAGCGTVSFYPRNGGDVRWPAGDGELLTTNGVPVDVHYTR